MTQFKHSCVLFVDPLGDPLEFYMRPCAARFSVMQMVRHGGGVFCTNGGPNIRRLVEPGTKVLNLFDGEVVLSVQYIYDCVEKNVLLDPKPYTVQVNSVDISDISDEDQNIPALESSPRKTLQTLSNNEEKKVIDYLLENSEDFKRLPLNEFCKQVVDAKIVDRSVFLVSDHLERLANNRKSTGLTFKKVNDFKKLWDKKIKAHFTRHDYLNMLNYIIENNLYHKMKDVSLFKEMYHMKVTFHSASEMQNHFKQNVLPNIKTFDISEEEQSLILKHCEGWITPEETVGVCKSVKQKRQLKNRLAKVSTGSDKSSEKNKKFKSTNQGEANALKPQTPVSTESRKSSDNSKLVLHNMSRQCDSLNPPCSPTVELSKETSKESGEDEFNEICNFLQTVKPPLKSVTPDDDALPASTVNLSISKKQFLDIKESSERSASPDLICRAKNVTQPSKSKKLTDCLASKPPEETQEISGRESPSLVPPKPKNKVHFKLYDPDLCVLSLPDSEDLELMNEVHTICQNITSHNVSDSPSNCSSGNASKVCLINNDIERTDVELPSVSRESTPDCLDSYDVALLKKLDGVDNTTSSMEENMSCDEDDDGKDHNVTVHPPIEEPDSQQSVEDVDVEAQSEPNEITESESHPCDEDIDLEVQNEPNEILQLKSQPCHGDVDGEVQSEPNEIPESVISIIEGNEQPTPSESRSSDYSEEMDYRSANEGEEQPVLSESRPSRQCIEVSSVCSSEEDEQHNSLSSETSASSSCSEPMRYDGSEDHGTSVCSPSTYSEQSYSESEGSETLFVKEAVIITYQLQNQISSIRNTDKKKSLQEDLEKLKCRMYKQFLEAQVKQIMKKPVLSVEDKALLTKYLAHAYKTTPEDILLEKCAALQP